MTDNQTGSQSTSTEVPSEEESITQEEWEEARNVLYQDVDKEKAKQLYNPSRAPTIRRLNFPINRNGPQDGTPISQIAAANKKRLEQMTLERAKQVEEKDHKMPKPLQCLDSKHIDNQAYGNDASVTFRRVNQSILKEIDLDPIEEISSEEAAEKLNHDLLMQKVSLLEDNLCNSMKKKLEAERNYKLTKSKLEQAYKELYATHPEADNSVEAAALEEILSKEFLKDRI